ncbi:hypothetical protein SEVIR_6G250300v4 [Setaria viridis]|uniref:Uncharacterized protein n=1 Tax=Setaria viridis TaxID=4556 RepID=A0A4U6U7Q9_SETVI|nr:uncharacterized protein LOC117861991 [Setaria viridis]TKW11698.1 hypothetical protein SEVIR_6G250300v2 [Setaria viridis]
MRELSCFGDGSVSVAAAAASVSGRGALDRSLQAATTSVYRAVLSTGKEMLVRVTWTRSAAGAPGVAVAFDDGGGSAPAARRSGQVLLQKRRGSRSLVTGAGTAVGVHWDIAEAKYASGPSPEPERDYGLAVVADAELALLLGAGGAAREVARHLGAAVPHAHGGAVLVSRREQLRGAAAAHVTRCRFREGGEEHEVAVHACRGGDGELRVSIDGEKVAEVRRVGWGFRGNRAAVLPDGEVVDVMWDVHDWWFGGRGGGGAGTGAQFMVKARAEKEGRLWMADETAARGQSPGGFFLHVQCYRR